MTATTFPTCETDGCDQQIYLKPDERTVCEACRLRGGPPPPKVTGEEGKQLDEEQRVRDYLAGMEPERRRWNVDNLAQFNTAMAEQWSRILAEMEQPDGA
ncbi:hypothetical protein [Amycolatopsis aidingensis]|uniref:hypothetical protein n=1 Tax=Amycolatopsis aidingensis TaxID=2842453 RepID=UPI001C0B6BD3|nr:hypothetical protein [Amycolatopsis aidingensis]